VLAITNGNTSEAAAHKSTGGKFGTLAGFDTLTQAQIAKFDTALDLAVRSHPDFEVKLLDVKKIAQDEADTWLKLSRDNALAGGAYKSTGGAFAELTGSDRLTAPQKAKLDEAIDTAIGIESGQGISAIDASKIKIAAQDTTDKLLEIANANITAAANFKSGGTKFTELANTDKLSGPQKTKLDQNIDEALRTDPKAGVEALDVKKIAQDALDALLGLSQANADAGNDFKTGGGKFSELTGTDRLTGGQKTRIDTLIQERIQNHPNLTLDKVDVKKIAQDVVGEIQALAKTGLSQDVDEMIDLSPTLKDAVFEFNSSGAYTITKVPGGIYCNASNNQINLDPAWLTDGEEAVVQAMSHETGHAKYNFIEDNYVARATTRLAFIREGVEASLIDEAEATLFNCQVRAEILKSKGNDIGVAGQSADKYIEIYERLEAGSLDRQAALQQIANTFRHGESPSISGFVGDYEKYYAERVWAPIATRRGLT